MKHYLLMAALLAGSTMATPLLARDDVLTQYDRWEQKLRARVEKMHVYPRGAEKDAAGDVWVRFRVGGNGKPQDITIVRSSGQAIFDAAAVKMIAKLTQIGPIPSAGAAADTVMLKLSYGRASGFGDDRRLAAEDARERSVNERRSRLIVSRAEQTAENR